MVSSSTSESDSSLPVSSACKAQKWYESQSRRLNNEGEKFFPRFARTDRRYAPLCTCQSLYKIASYIWPCTQSAPPLQHSQIRPCCMQTQTATDSTNVKQFSSWLPPLQKKVMYGPALVVDHTYTTSQVTENTPTETKVTLVTSRGQPVGMGSIIG